MSKVTVKNYEMKEFVILQNYLFQNKDISLKAKGLLGYMLSLPSDWDYTIGGLSKSLLEGKSSIQSALNELENAGYLERIRTRKKGKFNVDYIIHSKPKKVDKKHHEVQGNKHVKKQATVTDLPQPKISHGSSIYTKKEKQSTKVKKDNKDKGVILPPNLKIHYLTQEMINRRIIHFTNEQLDEYDLMFKELDKLHGYKNVLKVARYQFDYVSKNKNKIVNVFQYLKHSFNNELGGLIDFGELSIDQMISNMMNNQSSMSEVDNEKA